MKPNHPFFSPGILGLLLILLAAALSACGQPEDASDPATGPETAWEIHKERESMENRCARILDVYYDLYIAAEKTADGDSGLELSETDIDKIEWLLIDAGFDVMDSNGAYPPYLATAERFYRFWDNVRNGKDAQQEIIRIFASGGLSYTLFQNIGGACYVSFMAYGFDSQGKPCVMNYEKHSVKDMELTEKGNFYYRIYAAGDTHYPDYSLIRLTEPDPELWDLNLKYIAAGGYVAVNIFLTDWTEGDLGALSFNDLWECLYYDFYGEPFSAEGYTCIPEKAFYEIPAAEFEKVVLTYFHIDPETFREKARYNAQGDYYPWRPLDTDDYVTLRYDTFEPEVTAYRVNSDGTVTLTVEALSTDLKTDCLFAHEVTVRPLEDGRFQFVGNRVTCETEVGLPFCEPRLTWTADGPA